MLFWGKKPFFGNIVTKHADVIKKQNKQWQHTTTASIHMSTIFFKKLSPRLPWQRNFKAKNSLFDNKI
jgi:hypothetical protein